MPRRRPDKIIQIQRRNPIEDTAGEVADNWQTYASVFARIVDKREGRFDAGEQIHESTDTIFRIRPMEGIGKGDRVIFNETKLFVHEIEKDEERENPFTIDRWIDIVTSSEKV